MAGMTEVSGLVNGILATTEFLTVDRGRQMQKALSIVLLGWVLGGAPHEALAAIVLDGTVGPAGPLTGPDYAIPSTVGARVGSNLFHSFANFDLFKGESATFSGPATIDTVIARVTGGNPSRLNGPLRCDIAGADLFFLNPAGILFGPEASLDLSGSFYASTATSLALGSTGTVAVADPAHDLLTTAPPSAFGFVGAKPGAIRVKSSGLTVREGESISLVGGRMTLVNSGNDSLLRAPGGEINLVAMAGPGQIGLTPEGLDTNAVSGLGSLAITNTADHPAGREPDIDVSRDLGGNGGITIRSGRFLLDGGELVADSGGAGSGRDITIEAREGALLDHGALVSSETYASGQGGSIMVTTPRLTIQGGARLVTSTWSDSGSGGGRGGDVRIDTDRLTVQGYLFQDDEIQHSGIDLSSNGSGGAGEVAIRAGAVRVTDEGWISADANATGAGGELRIDAETISVSGHGWLSADTFGTGSGGGLDLRAGSLAVTTGGKITADTYGAGKAGAMTIEAEALYVGGYAVDKGETFLSAIRSDTSGSGSGGVLSLTAPVMVVEEGGSIDARSLGDTSGKGGEISITADTLTVRGYLAEGGEIFPGAINASSYGAGEAGDIAIKAGTVMVEDEGVIYADANGSGAGGQVQMDAGDIVVREQGWISSDSYGSGNAGSVDLTAGGMELTSAGRITSDSYRSGQAGTLTVTAEAITVSGYLENDDQELFSTISSDAHGRGRGGEISLAASDILLEEGGCVAARSLGKLSGGGGNISVTAGSLTVKSFADLNVTSSGSGSAGDIVINAGAVTVAQGGTITSSVNSTGQGGDISITTDDLILTGYASNNGLVMHSRIDSSSFGAGQAGNIAIAASTVKVEDAARIASYAKAGGGGGDISITADRLLLRSGGAMDVSSYGLGDAGDIVARAATIRLDDKALILSAATSSGDGGTISLLATDSLLMNDASIASLSVSAESGAGQAGDITMTIGNLWRMRESVVATSSENADGGNIWVDPALIDLIDSEVTTSVQGGVGNGGNIDLNGRAVVLDASTVLANAHGGDGGNITLTADLLLRDPESRLSASSALGLQGVIALHSPLFDIGAEIANLPESFLDADSLLPKRCVEQEEEMSSFVLKGRGGLPPSPVSPLRSL